MKVIIAAIVLSLSFGVYAGGDDEHHQAAPPRLPPQQEIPWARTGMSRIGSERTSSLSRNLVTIILGDRGSPSDPRFSEKQSNLDAARDL